MKIEKRQTSLTTFLFELVDMWEEAAQVAFSGVSPPCSV